MTDLETRLARLGGEYPKTRECLEAIEAIEAITGDMALLIRDLTALPNKVIAMFDEQTAALDEQSEAVTMAYRLWLQGAHDEVGEILIQHTTDLRLRARQPEPASYVHPETGDES